MNVRGAGVLVIAAGSGVLCGCVGGGGRGEGAEAAPPAMAPAESVDVKAGELPEWWIQEPRAVGSVVSVSASGMAPEAGVARDLALRNARAAGRAVLGVEPVRVVVVREAQARARTGDYEAFVLARCDGAGAAALPVGGERAARPAGGAPVKKEADAAAPAASRTERAEPASSSEPARPGAAAEAPPTASAEARPAPADPSGLPTWWFEDVRRDGTSARACASADGSKLVDTRRAAVEAAKEKLRAHGVSGAVQTLFIATRKPEGVGYRVFVMGQGEVGK